MTLFLTSSPSGCPFDPGPVIPVLDPRNHFVENLHAAWPQQAPRCLMLAADPDNFGGNDQMRDAFIESFRQAGLPLAGATVCDRRNQDEVAGLVAHSGFLMLCGGHVPTQNRFFAQLGLPALLHGFDGIVLGISAGTMNAARTVYVQPELPGESVDPDFVRFVPGLGLTDVMILPHYQKVKDSLLDGKRLFEDITYADSMGRTFIAIVDGSYLLIENGSTRLFGEAYRIADGRIQKLCTEGDNVTL